MCPSDSDDTDCPQDPNEHVVTLTYKGHQSTLHMTPKEGESIDEYMQRNKIYGGVDRILYPGDWEYDPETMCARPIQY
jgi:hypothetical protein